MTALLWRLRFYVLSLFVLLLLPLLLLYLLHRAVIKRRPMTGLWRKFFGHNPKPPQQDMILVHGVSMGEVNLMRPLIPLIEQKLQKPCMLSSSTDTGWRSLQKHFADHHCCFFPLDLPWAIRHFFQRQRPSMIILLELEIWPLFLAAAFQRRIPVIMLNARVGDRSFQGYQRAGWFWRPIFKAVTLAIAQNDEWAERLRQLGVERVHTGDLLKADVVQCADANDIAAERQRLQLDQRPVLLAASTSSGEEELFLSIAAAAFKDWRVIICPRHPERGPVIQSLAAQHGFAAVCTSTQAEAPAINADDLIIVDEIGRLGALYALAEIAVVGGSFGSMRHGQNMLESAAAGTCTVVGWDTSNQPDAMALLRTRDALVECRDPEALKQELIKLAAAPERRQQLAANGKAAWQSSTGAAERSVSLLAEILGHN